jgi:hypothetical protein
MRVGGNLVAYFIELLFRLGTLGGRALSLSKTQKTHWNFFLTLPHAFTQAFILPQPGAG